MRKNVSGQIVSFVLVSREDGSPVTTGTTTVYVVGDNGTQTTGAGSCVHKGVGLWFYFPPQAETNYDKVVFVALNALAVAARVEYETDIPSRLAEQVPVGPIAAIPAPPSTTQTRAWVYCYDEHGSLAPGVLIEIALKAATGYGSYSTVIASAASDSSGRAELLIPRGAGLSFAVRRNGGRWFAFTGEDAATLQLPAAVGGN